MIKRLDVQDISQILTLDDHNFKNLFSCELGEWVQFLIQNIEDENFFMFGSIKDKLLTGYIVAYFVPLPICKGVSVLYSKTAGLNTNKKILDELISWSEGKGALSIDIITNNTKGHSIYGFKKSATMMQIKL